MNLALLSLLIASAPVLHDTDVVVDRELIPLTQSTAYVAVRGATSLTESKPIEAALVTATLAKKHLLARSFTDGAGRVTLRFMVPDLEPGTHELLIETKSTHGDGKVRVLVQVKRKLVLHARTDRTVYRPGETIHWSVVLLSRADAHPLTGRKIDVVLKDPRGTEIWRGSEENDRSGRCVGSLPLSADLLTGKYRLEANAKGVSSTTPFEVRAIEYPAFDVKIVTDTPLPLRKPETLRGRVVARYPYGEPVRGRVRLMRGGWSEVGELDAEGQLGFTLSSYPNQPFTLSARVTDGAERSEMGSVEIPIGRPGLNLALIPERKELVPATPHWVTVITTDAVGNLAPATVRLESTGLKIAKRRLDSDGAVRFLVTPLPAGELSITAHAVTKQREQRTERLSLYRVSARPWIRTSTPLIGPREAIQVTGTWPEPQGDLVVSLLRYGAPLASTVAQVDSKGRLTASLHPPAGVFGLATVRVTEPDWDRSNGRSRQRYARTSIYLEPTSFQVEIQGQDRFRPGEKAQLLAQVTDHEGNPAANIGLMASAVDERALAIGKKQKRLLEVIRALDMEQARVLGLIFADLMKRNDEAAFNARAAIIESIRPSSQEPFFFIAAANRFRQERTRIARMEQALTTALVQTKGAIGIFDKKWRYRYPMYEVLKGAKKEDLQTPWQEPLDWPYATQLYPSLQFSLVASRVVDERMRQLTEQLRGLPKKLKKRSLVQLVEMKKIRIPFETDPWGKPFQLRHEQKRTDLVSAGPDGRFGSQDDVVVDRIYGRRPRNLVGFGARGSGMGGGGYGLGHAGLSSRVRIQAAIRKRFDETVLWQAGIVTDEAGEAKIEVDLADSITGWRVDVEAIGHGGIGHGRKRITTFLPLSVEAAIPRSLTLEDRYTVRAVVANHRASAEPLTVRFQATSGVQLIGESSQTTTVPSGTTRAVKFNVRAVRAGENKVTLRLFTQDGTNVDGMERPLRVDPPGQIQRLLATGHLENGKTKFDFALPVSAAHGSVKGRLRLYRGSMDQALDGLEGMLKEPHGCFEQTSSSTYPNLLVLGLLKGQAGKQELRQRATTLVGKGYQRLISYEVNGGGFSWFGSAPANQVLSAYGLLEFVDMAKVYPVDPALIERTRKWLLQKQNQDGSWSPDPNWLHDWSAVQGRYSTTAYVVWTLAESGYRGEALDRALDYLDAHEKELVNRPYLMALWASAASALMQAGPLHRLARKKTKDGLVFTADETLFSADKKGADIQVTALAAVALQRGAAFADARSALAYIWSARSPVYGWGTTQATVLALRALTQGQGGAPMKGQVVAYLAGERIGALDLSDENVPTLTLPELSSGSHTLSLVGDADLFADLRISWRTNTVPPPLTKGLAVALDLQTKEKIAVGQLARVRATISNPTETDVAMPTAVLPIPPGFRPDRRRLKAIVSSSVVSRYEENGEAIHLYLEKIHSGQELEIDYLLESTSECEVMQRPAEVYAYYDPSIRGASGSFRIRSFR